MRFIFGILVGAAFTVTGAYIHDSELPGGSNERLVNWDAAGLVSRQAMDFAREKIAQLTTK
jgi:hypothetical protein